LSFVNKRPRAYFPKDIFDFTTLKGDYHLTVSWCFMRISKSPTFMSPNMLRANAYNGSLVSKLNESSNLTGKNSYCILMTGHHICILMKYMTGLGKLYNSTFPPPASPCFTSSLNVSDYLFPGDTSQTRLTTPKVFYALRKDISL
jgi:hypothetical protein